MRLSKNSSEQVFTGRNSITTMKITKDLIFQKLPILDEHSFPELLQSLPEMVPLGHPLQRLLQKLETIQQTLDTETQCFVVPEKDCLHKYKQSFGNWKAKSFFSFFF